MINKNKKGISPLIATVLIIGFTIVLAALVITWGTKLFQTTVAETESTSKFSFACSTGLRVDVTGRSPAVAGATYSVTLRNNNQDRAIVNFTAVLNFNTGVSERGIILPTAPVLPSDPSLAFPVPKQYTLTRNPATGPLVGLTGIDLFPVFTIEGETKACENPIEVRTA